jgi:hypothetical protein
MPCPTNPNTVCWTVQIMKLFIIPISVLLRPFTVLRIPFSKIPSFCSSPKARHQCSYQEKQQVKSQVYSKKPLHLLKWGEEGKGLNWAVATIPLLHMTWICEVMLFCYHCTQIFKLCHIFLKKFNFLLHSGDTYAIIQCAIVHTYYNQWKITN